MKKTIILFLVFYSSLSYSVEYSIVFSHIPRPVTMNFPDNFHLASSQTDRSRRDNLLEFYKSNKAFKSTYDDILMKNWSNENNLPIIALGTLSNLESMQGRISKAYWDDLRKVLLETRNKQIEEIRKEWNLKMKVHSSFQVDVADDLLWISSNEDENSVTISAHVRGSMNERLRSEYIFKKLIFHNGYIIFANIHIDSSQNQALSEIRKYISEIAILSIK